jgi:hypothetical protein
MKSGVEMRIDFWWRSVDWTLRDRFLNSSHVSTMSMSMSRGAFIVLEGLDRSGKSTQVSRLIDRLQRDGRQARLQKFPGMLSLRWSSRRPHYCNWKDDRRVSPVSSRARRQSDSPFI